MADTALPGFCRDCLADAGPGPRCCDCGGPRLVRHHEIDELTIAHLDCDAFYAAIEKRDNPELREKPVIVGGGRRGVVATACYIARIHGVGSAMPMFKALERCPDAVVIRPDMEKYARVGREVRALMRELTPMVEPISIDEAFLDLSGTMRLHGRSPARSMALLARRIESEIGVTVSVGLSYNKFLAKVASDLDKPRGLSVIGRAEAKDFLARQPVGLIWGVGRSLQARLARDGIRTIGRLQSMGEKDLVARYGAIGGRLHRLSRGEDHRRVDPAGETKSISAETTFAVDLSDPADLERLLWRLSEKVSRRAKNAGIAGRTVVLKLKKSDFRTITRNHSLDSPTQLADRIFAATRPLLRRLADGTRYRLIGVGITQLGPDQDADPPGFIDEGLAKRARAERAMDSVRARFGWDAVGKGLGFSARNAREPSSTMVRR